MTKTLIAIAMASLLGTGIAANASVVRTDTNIDFTGGAASFSYLGSSFTLTDTTSGDFDPNPVSVSTAGAAAVTSLSLFGPTMPTDYFDPPRDSLIFDGSYQYSAFPTPTTIDYSATPSFIGLSVGAADGTHYGYAEFDGTYFESYAFETTAGVGIAAGAMTTPVPEPETWALTLLGMAGLGAVMRRRSKTAGLKA